MVGGPGFVASASPGTTAPSAPSLSDAAASGPDDIWAVGVDGSKPGIATHWDGTSWTWVPIAEPETTFLTTVGVLAPDDAWAAGHTFHLVHDHLLLEHWDGVSWKAVDVPGPTGELVWPIDMSRDGNELWLIGFVDRPGKGRMPFLQHFDGSRWRSVPAPQGSTFMELNSVYPDGAGNVWVAGSWWSHGLRQYVGRWDGQQWRRSNTGPFQGLGVHGGVDAITGRGTTLWAVADSERPWPTFLRRDDDGWHQTRIRVDGDRGASAIAPLPHAGPWVAVNSPRVAALRRTGSDWQPVGDPGSYERIAFAHALLVFSPTDAWLIGSRADIGSGRLHWDGVRWQAF